MSEENAKTIKMYKPTEADMKHYYENFLPFPSIFTWLNHSKVPNNDFTHREFAFEHQNGAYQRYNSFQDAAEFKKKVVKYNPTRFEIGAVYPVEPKDRKTVAKNMMKPLSKEMVLDIDLTDYDEIRTCCKGTSICDKCWKFITLAIKVVDVAIREDFGIENRIWVFSGRRGVHCWMSDSKIRFLKENGRRAFIEYLDILNVKGKSKKGIFGLKKPYHPHIERSLDILKDHFVDIILEEQGSWDSIESGRELALSIPDIKLRNALLQKWKDNNISSTDKWVDIGDLYKELGINSFDLVDWRKEMILQMLYPRLDVEVSRQMNHLLKSPFCVHPGTGNVCVVFDPNEREFNPFTDAPNLQQIFSADEFEWKNTPLKDSILLFRNYVDKLLKCEGPTKRENDELDF
ncbi:DNA primase small subunit [Pichia kudriavzevii]|uniref:DNA primase n=1 Tax=Pichia kudriavzevii TaxID=4909 RepID=A0A099P022_PICKU|nr:hypothetical protein JL09_g3347 [Pichia kudriavzevii]ONH71458.1 DNA primase small subunit [Pichia kudriavzevii]